MIGALICAPAIVRVSSLMRVKAVRPLWYGYPSPSHGLANISHIPDIYEHFDGVNYSAYFKQMLEETFNAHASFDPKYAVSLT